MRLGERFKNYVTRAMVISLYSIFFATQLFSITPDNAATTRTVSVFSAHITHHKIGIETHANRVAITEKNIAGSRLNKRFQPAEWFFIHTLCIESAIPCRADSRKKTFFKEPVFPSALLLFELLRGPPATA